MATIDKMEVEIKVLVENAVRNLEQVEKHMQKVATTAKAVSIIAMKEMATWFDYIMRMAPNINAHLTMIEFDFMRIAWVIGDKLEPVFATLEKFANSIADMVEKNPEIASLISLILLIGTSFLILSKVGIIDWVMGMLSSLGLLVPGLMEVYIAIGLIIAALYILEKIFPPAAPAWFKEGGGLSSTAAAQQGGTQTQPATQGEAAAQFSQYLGLGQSLADTINRPSNITVTGIPIESSKNWMYNTNVNISTTVKSETDAAMLNKIIADAQRAELNRTAGQGIIYNPQ
jgi:hypothetical protein